MIQASGHTLRSKLPTIIAAAMVVSTLIGVAGARLAGFKPQQATAGSDILNTRLIRFSAGNSGNITVIDAETSQVIAATGREGFIPGVLRGLNRLRKTGSSDVAAAYRLDQLENGQLLLTDTATGVTLDLNAYGQDNARVFNAFLPGKGDNS